MVSWLLRYHIIRLKSSCVWTQKLVEFLSYSYLYELVLNGRNSVSNAQEIETKEMVQKMNDQCCCVEQKTEERGRYTTSKIQTMGNSVEAPSLWKCFAGCQLRHGQVQACGMVWNGMEWYGNMQKHPLSPFKELEKSEHFELLKEVKSLNKSLGLWVSGFLSFSFSSSSGSAIVIPQSGEWRGLNQIFSTTSIKWRQFQSPEKRLTPLIQPWNWVKKLSWLCTSLYIFVLARFIHVSCMFL